MSAGFALHRVLPGLGPDAVVALMEGIKITPHAIIARGVDHGFLVRSAVYRRGTPALEWRRTVEAAARGDLDAVLHCPKYTIQSFFRKHRARRDMARGIAPRRAPRAPRPRATRRRARTVAVAASPGPGEDGSSSDPDSPPPHAPGWGLLPRTPRLTFPSYTAVGAIPGGSRCCWLMPKRRP